MTLKRERRLGIGEEETKNDEKKRMEIEEERKVKEFLGKAFPDLIQEVVVKKGKECT